MDVDLLKYLHQHLKSMKTVLSIIERHVHQVEPLIGNAASKNPDELTGGAIVSMLRGDIMLARVLHEDMRGHIERMGYKMPDLTEFVNDKALNGASSVSSSQTPAPGK